MRTPTITRGTTAVFHAKFYDENGALFTDVDEAKIVVKQGRDASTFDLQLETGSEFVYRLDTGDYARGFVYWSIYARAGTVEVARDGTLNLTAGPAN